MEESNKKIWNNERIIGDTSGTFHYRFSENLDTLIMQDSMETGGYFHGDWIILEFEEDTLAISRRYPDTKWADTIDKIIILSPYLLQCLFTVQ